MKIAALSGLFLALLCTVYVVDRPAVTTTAMVRYCIMPFRHVLYDVDRL